MLIPVPDTFAKAIRERRAQALSLLAIVSFVGAVTDDRDCSYLGCTLMVYLAVLIATYKLPLSYSVSARGICLTSRVKALALPLSLATNFWVSWIGDQVTEVLHTTYCEEPALLIRTRRNSRGTLLPVRRSDAEPAASYLRCGMAESDKDVNAFS